MIWIFFSADTDNWLLLMVDTYKITNGFTILYFKREFLIVRNAKMKKAKMDDFSVHSS